ncbi:phosphatase PAP2 family protein [Sulfurimonas sp.]|uniref:phosphatase PAP2 family protein n=1 Tax=Sulfurimonas sp. TaxID=2022749 RepID=UPI003561A24C
MVIFEVTDLDYIIQDLFYDFSTKKWILDRNEYILELIFYSGIKKVLVLFAAGILISLTFFYKTSFVKKYKKGLLVVMLSAIFIPLTVGVLKKITNTPCPKNIERYNGNYPNVKVFDAYPKIFKQECKIRCWPAGHASGGFALLSLYFLFKNLKNKKYALLFGLLVGWSMGIYKMLIGDHFMSHTLVTMFLAWIIILSIDKVVNLILIKENETKVNAPSHLF